MSGNEAFYDAEIAPALADLAKRCRERGMNFMAVVEYEHGEIGRTEFADTANAGPQFRIAAYAARAEGNVDALIAGIIKDDKRVRGNNPTNSVYIRLLERDHA